MPGIQDDAPDSKAIREYLMKYFAMQDLLSASVDVFDVLSTQSPTLEERARYWAQKLDAVRKLDLLNSKIEAYLQDTSSIRPPTEAELDAAQELATELGGLIANEFVTEETAKLIANVVSGFENKPASA
jgi:hypothetical protein